MGLLEAASTDSMKQNGSREGAVFFRGANALMNVERLIMDAHVAQEGVPAPMNQRVHHKRPVRLLVISSDTYPPFRVDVAVLFGQELVQRGHRIDWILQSEDACDRSYETTWNGCKMWVGRTDLGHSLFHRFRKHALGIWHDMKLISVVRRGDYDVIEVKDKFVSGLFAVVAKRWYRRRFVYWLSYPYPEEYLIRATDGTARYPFLYRVRGQIFRALLYKILLPAADHVFVQSEQMRHDVAREGIPLSKMTAVPMGIDARNAATFRSATAAVIDPAEPSILYLGTLTRVRRLDFLVRVLDVVKKHVDGAKLYLVGRGDDPADEQFLKAEAARLHIESSVVFVGHLPQVRALEYVRDAAVCVSPFFPTPILNSTSPTKLVEYMAMGKAVVANDHPEQRLVIEQSRAGICVPWSEEAFAAAIVELLRSPGRRHELGQRGRDYAIRHRSYDVIADAVEADLVAVAFPARVERGDAD
jgi:glycosyltransferase involved in cell wall biosynthesis